jgi:hypothetical protein
MNQLVALCALLFAFGVLGIYIGREIERGTRWIFCDDELPPSKNHIENYPVAFFDDEFGIVHDQAEFHRNRAHKWLSVPDGTPVKPFAWYNLPPAPHPRGVQDSRIKGGVNDYI